MEAINATNARQNLFKLISQTNETHHPIQILSKAGNAILISEEDWRAVQETLYLQSVPGLTESVLTAKSTPLEECEEVDWDAIK